MPKVRKDRWACRHDSQKVDLVFIVDCTGSMGCYIKQVQKHVTNISEIISRTAFDVHLGLIEYRDHPPQDKTFIVKIHEFTEDLNEMKQNVNEMDADGGGDLPEAVADALHAVLSLNFRPDSTKVAVLICDAPPHGLDMGTDQIGTACPLGLDPLDECRKLAKKEIILYCAGCEPALEVYRDAFIAFAHITGGTYVPIMRSQALAKIIINGCLQEISSEKLMGHVDDFVHLTLANKGSPASIDSLAEQLHKNLNLTNNKVERLLIDGQEVDTMTDLARKFSRLPSLNQIREIWSEMAKNGKFDKVYDQQHQKQSDVTLSSLQPVTKLHAERLLNRSISRGGYPVEHSMDDEYQVRLCPRET